MKKIAVFCGSSSGFDSVYEQNAVSLGKTMAEKGIDLIYGGAEVGLMGAIADSVIHAGRKVIGVMPRFLQEKEIAHKNLSELIVVEDMHQRKAIMAELCDGVIAMPGGFGTLDEFFEMLTWAQLNLHQKPVALFNIDSYYDGLMVFLQSMVDKGFLKKVNYDMIILDDNIENLLTQMENYKAPQTGKWIS